MLGQEETSKVDKFIETMPTLIQMHLVIEKTWDTVTKKAKELEHIIQNVTHQLLHLQLCKQQQFLACILI